MKKYIVYYNDNVEMIDMFQSDSLEECEKWISESVEGRTCVDEDNECSQSVFDSSKVFRYEVYQNPCVEEMDEEDILHDTVYESEYYYAD